MPASDRTTEPLLLERTDPIEVFRAWLGEAEGTEPNDPNAMALATATPGGAPSVRMVLLKRVDERGFVFYTNAESRKGEELRQNPQAALCFYWKSLYRQVRVEGRVEEVSAAEADAYFATRARESQLGAWASAQSRPLASRAALEERLAKYAAEFPGQAPRPPYWTGFLLRPERIEFWIGGAYRLHDRILFERTAAGWTAGRLFP